MNGATCPRTHHNVQESLSLVSSEYLHQRPHGLVPDVQGVLSVGPCSNISLITSSSSPRKGVAFYPLNAIAIRNISVLHLLAWISAFLQNFMALSNLLFELCFFNLKKKKMMNITPLS